MWVLFMESIGAFVADILAIGASLGLIITIMRSYYIIHGLIKKIRG